MKGNLKITALAAAVATFAMGTAAAQMAPPEVTTAVDTDIFIWGDIEAVGEVAVGGELLVGGDINLDVDYDYNDNFDRNVAIDQSVDQSLTENVVVNDNLDRNVTIDQSISQSLSEDVSYTEDVNYTANLAENHTLNTRESHSLSTTESHNLETNQEYSNIERFEYGRTDIRGERDEHGVSVQIDKSLSLSSDIAFTGDPTITGEIDLDSAAIAVVDNRQSNTENIGLNDMLTNDASIDSEVGSAASGNL